MQQFATEMYIKVLFAVSQAKLCLVVKVHRCNNPANGAFPFRAALVPLVRLVMLVLQAFRECQERGVFLALLGQKVTE